MDIHTFFRHYEAYEPTHFLRTLDPLCHTTMLFSKVSAYCFMTDPHTGLQRELPKPKRVLFSILTQSGKKPRMQNIVFSVFCFLSAIIRKGKAACVAITLDFGGIRRESYQANYMGVSYVSSWQTRTSTVDRQCRNAVSMNLLLASSWYFVTLSLIINRQNHKAT